MSEYLTGGGGAGEMLINNLTSGSTTTYKAITLPLADTMIISIGAGGGFLDKSSGPTANTVNTNWVNTNGGHTKIMFTNASYNIIALGGGSASGVQNNGDAPTIVSLDGGSGGGGLYAVVSQSVSTTDACNVQLTHYGTNGGSGMSGGSGVLGGGGGAGGIGGNGSSGSFPRGSGGIGLRCPLPYISTVTSTTVFCKGGYCRQGSESNLASTYPSEITHPAEITKSYGSGIGFVMSVDASLNPITITDASNTTVGPYYNAESGVVYIAIPTTYAQTWSA